MKNRFLAFMILFLASSALQAQDINKNDSEGKRHGLWKGTYESKKPRYEGNFEHGVETGTFKFFEDNTTSTLIATRTFAKDGSCYTTFFDDKGKKMSEGKEVNKLREGEWKFYQPGAEAILSVENYTKGKLDGIRKVYFPNKALAEEITYINGSREGSYKQYTEKGILLEESTYKNDVLHGPVTFRNSHGEVVTKGQFANNKQTGIWQYFEKGKLVKKEDKTNLKIELARKERKE